MVGGAWSSDVFPVIGLVELGALDVPGVLRNVLFPEVGRAKLGALAVVGALISAMDGAVGWLVLGETMDARKVIALGLILSGVLVLTMKGAAPAVTAEDATAQDDGHRGAERGPGAGSDPTESAEAARPGMR